MVFGIATDNTGQEASAKRAGKWYDSIMVGMQPFTDEWHRGQGDATETRRPKGKRNPVERQATAKRGRTDGDNKREEKHGGPRRGIPPRSGVMAKERLCAAEVPKWCCSKTAR
ncbi:unnamed protein product [Pylaiella littoralis]